MLEANHVGNFKVILAIMGIQLASVLMLVILMKLGGVKFSDEKSDNDIVAGAGGVSVIIFIGTIAVHYWRLAMAEEGLTMFAKVITAIISIAIYEFVPAFVAMIFFGLATATGSGGSSKSQKENGNKKPFWEMSTIRDEHGNRTIVDRYNWTDNYSTTKFTHSNGKKSTYERHKW